MSHMLYGKLERYDYPKYFKYDHGPCTNKETLRIKI